MLRSRYGSDAAVVEAGVDEAGRGCLAGPVFAAAVVWDERLNEHPMARRVRDSKRLSAGQRERVREFVEANCVYGVGHASADEIDRINIMRASHMAMHRAIDDISSTRIGLLVVDGNVFTPYIHPITRDFVPHACVVDGDSEYLAVAAAGVLAKTHRDRHVLQVMHPRFPVYQWDKNKGYGTATHMSMLSDHGPCAEHRRSFAPVRRALIEHRPDVQEGGHGHCLNDDSTPMISPGTQGHEPLRTVPALSASVPNMQSLNM